MTFVVQPVDKVVLDGERFIAVFKPAATGTLWLGDYWRFWTTVEPRTRRTQVA